MQQYKRAGLGSWGAIVLLREEARQDRVEASRAPVHRVASMQRPPESYKGGFLQGLSATPSSLRTGKVRPTAAPVTELQRAHLLFCAGNYLAALEACEAVYETDACRTEVLLLLGALHFQLRNYPECVFFSQQAVRVDPGCAEAYSNMGNALKELGDIEAAVQFYLQAVKLKPRFADAYNNLACCYLQQNQIEDAVDTFQMAVLLNPSLIDAHSNLGALFKSQGNLPAAKKCYFEAIRLKPDFAIAWNNLAGVFREDGQLTTAVAYYLEAIRLSPSFPDAFSNLGNVYRDMRQHAEAVEAYKEAIRLRPEFAVAYGNLGSCYLDMQKPVEATRCLRHAIQLDPRCADFFNGLGNAVKASSTSLAALEEAVQCYRSALRLQPNYPQAYNNLGCTLRDVGMVKEALHCFVTSARLAPTFTSAHCNIGALMAEQGLHLEAIAHLEEAMRSASKVAVVHLNLGSVMNDMGRPTDALTCYRKAADLDPSLPEAHACMGGVLAGCGELGEALQCLARATQLDSANMNILAAYLAVKARVCSWEGFDAHRERLLAAVREQVEEPKPAPARSSLGGAPGNWRSSLAATRVFTPAVHPTQSLYYPFTPAELLQIAKKYSAKTKSLSTLFGKEFKHSIKAVNGKLKIGYVSSDFGSHPLGTLIASLIKMHDRHKFEVNCYSLSASDSSTLRSKFENDAHVFRDLSELHFSDGAAAINDDEVKILINLNGFSSGNRNEIFALQPATIQMSFLGFSGSSGADYMNYLVADDIVVPAEQREHYSESLLMMPHSHLINDHKQSHRYVLQSDRSGFPIRGQYGISEDKFVFCNFGPHNDINPEIFDVWMRILKRVPNSILWLVRHHSESELNLFAAARERGVREEQLVFSDVAGAEENIKRGILADLCLDTSCVSSGPAACDILWGGTPLLAIQGSRFASRVSSSLLAAVGLSELVCTSLLGMRIIALFAVKFI